MPRAKRLVIIEDKNQNDTPQITSLLQNIRSTQHKLLKDVFVSPAGTPIYGLVEAFEKLIYNELLNYPINDTFHSIESVNQRFAKLLENFKSESLAQGVIETHKLLCEGLQLIIQWYHIQAIEAFLYTSLADEFAVKEKKAEVKVNLRDKFDAVILKINHFNERIEEIEQGLEYYKLPVLDMKATDLKEILQPLLVEELKLNILPNQAKTLEKLEQERLFLVKNLDDLNREMEQEIRGTEESLKEAKEKRDKLYDPSLHIDVYYVDEFRKKYKETFDSYKKILMSGKRDEYLKVENIEKLLQQFSNPFRDFELSLGEYCNHTSALYSRISSYYYSINGIYELLTQQFSAFKLNSSMLRLEAQYHEQYTYLRDGLPEVKKIVEENFFAAANEFLRDVATRNESERLSISSQAKDAFDDEVLIEALMARPSNLIPTIKSFTPKALKRDKLNQNWNEIFQYIFTQELQAIKSEFDALGGQSATDLALLKKMENRLRTKREALDAILDESQYPNICGMFEGISICANFDPIMLAVRDRISNLEKAKLSFQDEHKPLIVSGASATDPSLRAQQSNPESGLPRSAKNAGLAMTSLIGAAIKPTKPVPKTDSPSHWYASLTNKTWKRAICYGLLAFALVMIACTVWGLIAEMSAAAILMSGLGFGGLSFSVTSGTYYVGKKCCCKKMPDVIDEPDQAPLSRPVLRQVQLTAISSDQKGSRPEIRLDNNVSPNPGAMRSRTSNNGPGLFDHGLVGSLKDPLLGQSPSGGKQSRRM